MRVKTLHLKKIRSSSQKLQMTFQHKAYIIINKVSMLGQKPLHGWINNYIKLQVHSMNHWVVYLSYCLETLLSCHLLAIDHCILNHPLVVSPFMVALCIECSQQLSSLPKYSNKLVLNLTSKHSESYSCTFGMASSRTAALSH